MHLTDSLNPNGPKTVVGLSELTVTGLLGSQLMGLYSDADCGLSSANFTSIDLISRRDSFEFAYFYASSRKLDHDILDVLFSHAEMLTPLQNCVLQALFLSGYLDAVMRFQATFMYTRILTQRYYDAITLYGNLNVWCSDVNLMWLLFIGVHIARDLEKRRWFIANLAETARLVDIKDKTA
jgi:hypothetical protein